MTPKTTNKSISVICDNSISVARYVLDQIISLNNIPSSAKVFMEQEADDKVCVSVHWEDASVSITGDPAFVAGRYIKDKYKEQEYGFLPKYRKDYKH